MSAALLSDLRNRRFLAQIATRFLAWIGLIASAGQVADWIFHLAAHDWWPRLLLAAVGIGVPVVLWWSWPRPIEETYDAPNTRIRIVKGDLLAETEEHLVIGTCDTFDTATPHVIARESLQGKALERLYHNDVGRLDAELDRALSGTTFVGTVAKAGKTTRYPLGTVAVVDQPKRNLYFVAISVMDEDNKAQGSPDGFWTSLNELWETIRRTSNGRPVCMPVIGGGLSRVSNIVPQQDALRFMILSFMFASRANPVCSELRIVLLPQDYEKLDRLEMQAFLSSLKPS